MQNVAGDYNFNLSHSRLRSSAVHPNNEFQRMFPQLIKNETKPAIRHREDKAGVGADFFFLRIDIYEE